MRFPLKAEAFSTFELLVAFKGSNLHFSILQDANFLTSSIKQMVDSSIFAQKLQHI